MLTSQGIYWTYLVILGFYESVVAMVKCDPLSQSARLWCYWIFGLILLVLLDLFEYFGLIFMKALVFMKFLVFMKASYAEV